MSRERETECRRGPSRASKETLFLCSSRTDRQAPLEVHLAGGARADVVRFSDGHNDQYAKVKVAIRHQTASNALEHELLADIEPAAADADALLHRLALGDAPVSAVHFDLLDCTPPHCQRKAAAWLEARRWRAQDATATRLQLRRHGHGDARPRRPRRSRTATRPDGDAAATAAARVFNSGTSSFCRC